VLLKSFRPDRLLFGADKFVTSVFSSEFINLPELNFVEVIEKESSCHEPLILCSKPGFDASSKVDDLAVKMGKQYKALAMGSDDGNEAEKTIFAAAKSGTWVLLKSILSLLSKIVEILLR
jgi:dynein heavy chain 1